MSTHFGRHARKLVGVAADYADVTKINRGRLSGNLERLILTIVVAAAVMRRWLFWWPLKALCDQRTCKNATLRSTSSLARCRACWSRFARACLSGLP